MNDVIKSDVSQIPPKQSDLVRIFRDTKKGAEKRKIPFTLSFDYFRLRYTLTGGCCEVSKIPFDMTADCIAGSRRPFVPSVDRINSSLGYTPENVRIVCYIVNSAMGTWGDLAFNRPINALFAVRASELNQVIDHKEGANAPQKNSSQQAPLKIIRMREVLQRTGLTRSTVYAQMKAGIFPSNFKIGLSVSGWNASEVDEWVRSRVKTAGFSIGPNQVRSRYVNHQPPEAHA